MANYETTLLALSPQSYWRCEEAGSTLADLVGGKNLTVSGTPTATGVSTGFPGNPLGINFGAAGNSWATIASSLASPSGHTAFSMCGWFYWNGSYGSSFSTPILCCSFTSHVSPFYIFFLGLGSGTAWRYALDTTGAFVPQDTAVAMPSTDSWHFVAFSWNGSRAKIWHDGGTPKVDVAFTGTIAADAMGSFAINNIPALNVSGNAGPLRAAGVGYWSNYGLTQGDVDALYAGRLGSASSDVLQQLRPITIGGFV